MRKCKYRKYGYKEDSDSPTKQKRWTWIEYEGDWLAWSSESEGNIMTGSNNEFKIKPIALIQDSEGKVHSVNAEDVQFIDKVPFTENTLYNVAYNLVKHWGEFGVDNGFERLVDRLEQLLHTQSKQFTEDTLYI